MRKATRSLVSTYQNCARVALVPMQRPATHLSPGGPTSVKSPKQTTVITRHVSSVGQKPILDSKAGNTRNIGSVGSTYQNVYQAWFATLAGGWSSICSQIRVKTVTN